MSFSPQHRAIFDDGIKPGLLAAGYRPFTMLDVKTNEDINLRMLVEIRKAEFVVAEFTGLKAGVYFESGFALGLHREVFWVVDKETMDKKELHFDTDHYQFIVWESLADLSKKLREKVEGMRGVGPFPRNPSVG